MTATQTELEPTSFDLQRSRTSQEAGVPSRSILYMDVIKAVVEELVAFNTMQSLLAYVVTALQERLDFYIASIFRYDHQEELAVLIAQDGQSYQPAPLGYQQSVHIGLLGQALTTGQPLLVNDVLSASNYVSPAGYEPAASELCVPIWSNNVLWGVFNVESMLPNAFIHDDQVALEVIAAQLGSAIYNLELREQQRGAFDALADHAERQRQLLEQVRQLATPVFPLAPGVLALPLIGILDSERMQATITTLLDAIQRTHSTRVLIEVSGIAVIDRAVAYALAHMTQASRLLGTEIILTGMRPDMAQALVAAGGDLSSMTVHIDFAAGLSYALQRRNASERPQVVQKRVFR